MQLILIEDKQSWESQVLQFSNANFLQSWQWGVFQSEMGKKVLRIQIIDSQTQKFGVAQIVIEAAKRGRYAALAGGPLLDWKDEKFVSAFFEHLIAEVKKYNCVCIRFRPQELEVNIAASLLQKIGAISAPMHLTADLTLQLDCRKSSEELLSEMRKNTRYEVKKAEKLGIVTRVSSDSHEITAFYEEQLKVATRHNFVPFSLEFLQKQFEAFTADDQAVLVHSYLGEQLLASAFVIFYNNEAVYHYGISTEENARLPGSYATQWRAILEAQARGCEKYNFWGIAPEAAKNHRFAGVSLFKRGFGGDEVAYLPAHDIVLSPWYWVSWSFEMLRRKMRRL